MKTLNRDALLKAKGKAPTEIVDIPEWGGSVIVKGISAGDEAALRRRFTKKDKNGEPILDTDDEPFGYALIARSLVDDQGGRLLEDGETELISSLSSRAFRDLFRACMKVNGYERPEGNS